jgi:hypothetical protein
MGLTSNLGKLSNMITSTGSAVGIAQSSPAYTLDVTGTGRFTGNVGIGIAPLERLTISGSNGLAGMIRWTDSATASAFIGITSGGVAYIHSNNNSLAFGANGSNNFAETMRLSSGNVGIGITNPTQRFQVYSTASTTSSIFETNSVNSYIALKSTAGLCYIGNVNYAMTFEAGGSERMRIFSNGNVAIGTSTDTTFKFTAQGEVLSDGDSAALFVQARDLSTRYAWYASGSTYLNFYNTGNGVTGQFTRTNGAYTALSDVNKKKDFEESTIGLDAILGLKPTLFRMKADDETINKQLGFIAQEVKEFIPQAYVETGEGDDKFIGLQDRPIIAALVKAIQEQQQEINELKSLINK